jgi:hypothetical protein
MSPALGWTSTTKHLKSSGAVTDRRSAELSVAIRSWFKAHGRLVTDEAEVGEDQTLWRCSDISPAISIRVSRRAAEDFEPMAMVAFSERIAAFTRLRRAPAERFVVLSRDRKLQFEEVDTGRPV